MKNQNKDILDEILDSITPDEQKSIDRKMMLAAKIFHAMKAKGWNQATFAIKIGQKPPVISKWLSGTHNFEADTLWRIGDILGVELLPTKENEVVEIVKYETILLSMQPASSQNKRSDYYYDLIKPRNVLAQNNRGSHKSRALDRIFSTTGMTIGQNVGSTILNQEPLLAYQNG